MKPLSPPKVLCVDAWSFIRIRDRSNPLHQLRVILQMQGADVYDFDVRALQTPASFAEIAASYGVSLSMERLGALEKDLRTELEGITLLDEAVHTVKAAKALDFWVVISADMAWPYGYALTNLLRGQGINASAQLGKNSQVRLALSYQVGFTKSAPDFYQAISSATGVKPSACMMVGTDMERDVRQPLLAGWRAGVLIDEDNPSGTWGALEEGLGLIY
jgi:FMN phosphatase YigB (HAD superfamily)